MREGVVFCLKESFLEGGFMGIVGNIGDIVKYKDISVLSWRVYLFCLIDINY